MFFFAKKVCEPAKCEPVRSSTIGKQRVTEEVKAYLRTPQIQPHEDPLRWWRDERAQFPVLAQVAQKILAIPASSAPSERVFSKMARINAKDRASMKPSLTNALLMI